ncbi:GatB/YqeY domain-containing protein [Algicella marina]|uniref:GatB/YqeY domain-containing protein n=1 Tax=Algicella marina TaxID=2683284 RepID=A0A6P1T3H7_9RHOB|nr:GatB/YqeY domain-containing protein [Algicella marina]QHQ35062.1 GatB/YqeY domain-containing protein [Algicella marina]
MIRKRLSDELKEAMKARETTRLSTLRLINAAIKDRDIAARSEDNTEGVSDADILGILAKMIKQRQDSAAAYDEAGRVELAEGERAEISVIQSFLPKQLSEEEQAKAIADAIAASGATSIRDMGKVMGVLKSKYAGQMDFARVGPQVKAALG